VRLINLAKRFVAKKGIPSDRFEFQLLYGVRSQIQRDLTAEGFNMRVYVPYGEQWYPYFMRRLAERPANLIFMVSNLLRK
jgi:proline dehydrogenase